MKERFRSIKGRILLMGGIAIAAAVLLGYVGMAALNRSSGNYDVLNSINKINLYQYENRSLDTSYLHFPDNAYLENIIRNLGEMEKLTKTAQGEGAGEVKRQLSSVADTVAACKDNYEEILALSTERGFTEDVGLYAAFLENDDSMSESFLKIRDDKSWLDGKWIELAGRVKKVKVQGKVYYKFTYTNEIPKLGKRENLLVRLQSWMRRRCRVLTVMRLKSLRWILLMGATAFLPRRNIRRQIMCGRRLLSKCLCLITIYRIMTVSPMIYI